MTTETKSLITEEYSVQWELTGHEDRWAVARFKGHWIGESTTEEGAWEKAREYARGHG